MKQVADVHFRVIDKGIFIPVARRLSRNARMVTYWTPHERPFPKVSDCVGDGFPDITRVESPWTDIDDVDCFVFPDVGFADLQDDILSHGKPVWGARHASQLELARSKFLKSLQLADLPVPRYTVVTGISKLREHLREKEDLWIKISRYRGELETMHWRSLADDEPKLSALSVKLGPFSEHLDFYVFEPIETDNEDGVDTWYIKDQHPSLVIHGMEAKDKAYIATWQKYSDLPEVLRKVNDAFDPILGAYDYRGFFSTEVRITDDGTPYFTDPTCRAGSPPSQVMTEMISNYGEVIWGGANGNLVEPEVAAKFGVQALICVCGDRREWRTLKVDDDLDRWAKCPNSVWSDGRLWFPPDPNFHYAEGKEIGWLVGIGDKLAEAIRHLQHNAKLLPDGASCEFYALSDLIQQIEKAESQGMEFTDQPVPPPEIVMDKT